MMSGVFSFLIVGNISTFKRNSHTGKIHFISVFKFA